MLAWQQKDEQEMKEEKYLYSKNKKIQGDL
jgi:hypothetical protein